ncbi:murein transglycosylase A [Accumulibacter sp.]|uniref:murein transglycosylase A n=1 Tax=Accumulibacter sp. TaxID=2053492 RepID=UPI0025E89E29|nr:murein transglycosylase A [Accumulibacter sp.]MCM8613891.1 murein transglycosylase A [Accumulibacter sp.]MCM8637722.1 murein transglycosylase A [Accumulibacter sp.]MCM8641064.1 murein transglycosylase A [Accumulibacter sp.]
MIRKSQPRRLLVAALAILLAACGSTGRPPPTTGAAGAAVCPPCPDCPAAAPAVPAAAARGDAKPLQAARWSELPGWRDDDLAAAWQPFLQSCRGLASRPQWPQWKGVCDEAKGMVAPTAAAARAFFEARLQPWQLTNADGSSSGLVTGYYEPLLRGSRTRGQPYLQPVLGVPPDLLTIDLGSILPELKNMRLRGRLQGNRVVPYLSRAEIGKRANEGGDRVLLYVDDPVELFFLQVQGSGRVQLPDGSKLRLAYADQNGHPYQSIGRVLVDRGEMSLEQASMQSIKQWARANPGRVTELLNANPSYVFFREEAIRGREGDGPNGALGVPLTPERSIAVDPRHVSLGAPVFLATTQPDSAQPWRRLVMAQDTGGAIRGVVRADLFWGFGAAAGSQAGRMKQQGQMWVLLPAGTAPP